MALRLRVTGPQAAKLGERVSRVFGVQGGRIGRATDNDWQLPDPERYLSGHHASIEYRGGTWFVLDTSSNGTYVNDRPEPLGRDHAQAVTTGDRLRMGEYQFVVSVSPDNDFPPDVAAAAAYDPASDADFALATHGDLGAELDVKGLLRDPTPPPDESPEEQPGVRVSDAYGQMVTVAMPPRSPEPRAAPRPVMQSVPTSSSGGSPQRHGGSLRAFCRGAGIDADALAPEHAKAILTLAGQLIRELTLGLITGLQYRTEQTGRYQIEDTSTLPAANNTFRMSTSVDEALSRLFAPHSTRFLTPLEAVRTSFADLRRHDQAMVIGMQDAVAEYLKRLAPEQLEQQFGEVLNRSGALPPNPHQKYWDMYAELYRVLAQMAPEGLPRAFAEEFSKAYQTATQELREKAKRPTDGAVSGRRAP
ncbi:MAG TPA: type VI secretion system-associated FHA domain protein TagH [Steroidobacteraceae bacterium]|nr:type VI secretion system-associated FHA domain protein TagH [Steroidobacteraceae bacterium]